MRLAHLARVTAAISLFTLTAALFAQDISTYDDYTYTHAATGTHVRIYVDGEDRIFESNALPDHPTGSFPNATISAQELMFTAPASPELAAAPTDVGLGKFGVAINGVPFERQAAEWFNDDRGSGWQYDAIGGLRLGIDANNAHVQPTGLYHYHGVPDVLVDPNAPPQAPQLAGFAGDGFPIYLLYGYEDPLNATSTVIELQTSYQLRAGTRGGGPGGAYDGTFNEDWEYVAGTGDLDACNGRFGITPEFPGGTYHYVLTQAFPRIPTCWSGTPGEGWSAGPGGRRPPQGGNGGQRPPGGGNGNPPPPGGGNPPRPGG